MYSLQPSRAGAPVHVDKDSTLRVKIVDACGMTCTFCHNEGARVAIDNRPRSVSEFTGKGRSGRMSIYAESNGARFLPAPISADGEFRRTGRVPLCH